MKGAGRGTISLFSFFAQTRLVSCKAADNIFSTLACICNYRSCNAHTNLSNSRLLNLRRPSKREEAYLYQKYSSKRTSGDTDILRVLLGSPVSVLADEKVFGVGLVGRLVVPVVRGPRPPLGGAHARARLHAVADVVIVHIGVICKERRRKRTLFNFSFEMKLYQDIFCNAVCQFPCMNNGTAPAVPGL